MNQSIDFKQTGGLFIYQDTLDYMQTAYGSILDAIAESFGDLVIVAGLNVTANTVTSGWIVYNKSIYPVAGGQLQSYLYEVTDDKPEQFEDGSTKTVYKKRSLAFTNTNTGIAWTDVKRLPFATTSLLDAFNTIQSLFNKMVFDEPVILSGCITSDLNTATSKVTISAGVVYIGGKMINTPVYNNSGYPVYINANGAYSSVQPSTPFILFDYETSQRYSDVLRRNAAHTGQVVTHTNADELQYFDAATGIGKWRWKGWKISDLLRSRVPVGFDNRTSAPSAPDNQAWDATYNTPGNAGGSNKQTLAKENLPNQVTITGKKVRLLTTANAENSVTVLGLPPGSNVGDFGPDTQTVTMGSGSDFDKRQPYRVVIQIERL